MRGNYATIPFPAGGTSAGAGTGCSTAPGSMDETAYSGRRLRIAYVADRFGPSKGGGEAYLHGLASRMAGMGHHVEVFTREADPAPAPFPVHVIRSWLPLKSLAMISFAFKAAGRARNAGFDVVHGTGKCLGVNVFNPHGGVEKAWLAQNYLSCRGTAYGLLLRMKRFLSLRHYFTLWQQKRLFGPCGAERIIAVSDMVKEDVLRWYGTAPERISVVYNGVDLERFSPRSRASLRAGERRAMGAGPDEMVLLNVGHNWRLKGLGPLIESLAVLKTLAPGRRFRLVVAGRGRQGPYARLARGLGVGEGVFFAGVRRDIEALYAAADVYVHPTFFDACSLALFEAMASGLPVVTTRRNGAAWALEGGEGEVIDDPADVPALARAVHAFFDPAAREKAGAAARSTAEKFPPGANADNILAVYMNLVSGK